MSAEENIKKYQLPPVPKPLGSYKPLQEDGNLLYLSGTLSMDAKGNLMTGRLGKERDIEDGKKASQLAALNALAVIRDHLGSLNQVKKVVRAVGHILATPDFEEHAQVMNGASDLLAEIFGESGKHARLSLGSQSLPKNATVELELIVSIKTL